MARTGSRTSRGTLAAHITLKDLGRPLRRPENPFDTLRRLGVDLTARRVIYDPAYKSLSLYPKKSRHTPAINKILASKTLQRRHMIAKCHKLSPAQQLFGRGSGGGRHRRPLPLKKAAIALHKMQRSRC